jgi:microcystin-dependent protein
MNSAAVVRIEDTETTFLDGYSLAFGTGKDSTISHDNTDGLEVVSSVKVTVQTTDDVVISGDTVELLSNNDVEITAPELLLNGSPIIPAGAVMAFAMNSAPAGWLKANGAAVSRTTYARLFAAIGVTFGVGDGITTFNLPDLRGEFVRGWVDNRTLAPETGRALGSAQNDAFQGHWHNIRTGNSSEAASPNPADRVSRRFSNALLGDTDLAVVTPVTDQVHGTPRISSETRPRNVALLYCIKT